MKIYAIPNEDTQYIGRAPSGAVLMAELRPTIDHVCTDQGDNTGIWVLDTMTVWEKELDVTDKDMPRWAEDLWDAIGIGNAPAAVKDFYNQKKLLRATKPVLKEITKG